MLLLSSVMGNQQCLDGGSMFGNVPRVMWSRWCPPDELGRIDLACRCFLVEDGGKKILVETGVGAFFTPTLKQRYGVVGDKHRLVDSLLEIGVRPQDIDVVFLSHLHFDHAGGLLSAFAEGKKAELVFERAQYVVGREAFDRASNPHPRDRASFIPELVELLTRSGRLQLVESGQSQVEALGDRIVLRESWGHTPGMLIPTMQGEQASATFCADLIPGAPWVHLPVTMGYDRFAEKLIDEKQQLFAQLGEGTWLLFTHDIQLAAAELACDERGKYGVAARRSRILRWDLDAQNVPSELS